MRKASQAQLQSASGRAGATSEDRGGSTLKEPLIRATVAASLAIFSLGTAQAQEAPAGNAFAWKLYNALPAKGNLFCSPFSVSVALQMVEKGARGETERQIASVLELPKGYSPSAALKVLTAANKDYQLSVVNRLWPAEGSAFLPEFMHVLLEQFGAAAQPLNFAGAPEAARKTINDWVYNATREKIQDLLPAGSVGSDTSMVLTNAIYFKGSWAQRFRERSTVKRPFHSPEGPRDAQFMNQTGQFPVYFGPDLAVLRLPYQGDRLSMLLVLPNAVDGAVPDPSHLESWLKELVPTRVRVSVPKFKLTESYELKKVLAQLGMNLLFAGADLSGMNGHHDLFLSLVQHKAFVDVNEEGTEAAAATAMVATRSIAMAEDLKVFSADHPFLFLILDDATGQILFMGRMSKPQG
jgi:serpin B